MNPFRLTTPFSPAQHAAYVRAPVRSALAEDVGSGDITAALIPLQQQAVAHIICRENAIICGRPWVDEVFQQLDIRVQLHWQVTEGQQISAGQSLVRLQGPARSLLTGERCAMNFLQILSGTASRCRHYANLIEDYPVTLLDTRKTLPGLRFAQKYAVAMGKCFNHRMGLYDAFLIKENHIAACGNVQNAMVAARKLAPDRPIEIEVETLDEFRQARAATADIILLDNFSLDTIKQTVQLNQQLAGPRPLLEASGGITEACLPALAATGIDRIAIGALTKDCRAIDLSMRLLGEE